MVHLPDSLLSGGRGLKTYVVSLVIVCAIGGAYNGGFCVFGQGNCPPEIEIPGNTSLNPLKLLVGTCQVQPESYVQRYSNVTIHGRAEGSGHCTRQLLSGFPPQCTVTWDGDRGVSKIDVKYTRPQWTGLLSAQAIFAREPLTNGSWHWPILDSEDTVYSFGPSGIGTTYTGTYEVFQQGVIFTTLCDMQPGLTETKSLKFYVVDCLPNFNHMRRRLPTRAS